MQSACTAPEASEQPGAGSPAVVVAASGWDVEGEPCSPVRMLARWLVGSGCGTFACMAWPHFHVRKMNLDPGGGAGHAAEVGASRDRCFRVCHP